MSETARELFEGWCILEIMGHRRLGGYVREQELAGAGFLRIDVPGVSETDSPATQFYPPSSVYCLTPVTEEIARAVAKNNRPQPVHRWELPAAEVPAPAVGDLDDALDDDQPLDMEDLRSERNTEQAVIEEW